MQFFSNEFIQVSTGVSITDNTPPTFTGITGLTQRPNGSLRATWSTATDSLSNISYEIFVKLGNATGLFNNSNLIAVTRELVFDIYNLQDKTNLAKDSVYYVGVRARDSVGNIETNTTSLFATSLGVADNSLFNLLTALTTNVGLIPTNPVLVTDLRLDDIAPIKAKTDNLPSDPASNTQVNTRLASSSYVAPDNATITSIASLVSAIKSKTDQITFTGGNVNSIAQVVSDKTGYELTTTERQAIASAVESAILNEGDGQAIIDTIVTAIGNSNIDEIALVAAIRADLERSNGPIVLTNINSNLIPALV